MRPAVWSTAFRRALQEKSRLKGGTPNQTARLPSLLGSRLIQAKTEAAKRKSERIKENRLTRFP